MMDKTIISSPEIIIDLEPKEEWSYTAPKMGDHIRVQRSGIYSHHGIYVSDDEVIHFTGTDDSILDWSKCEVIRTDLARFLRGGAVEVKIYNSDEQKDLYPAAHIVDYARSCLGDKGYNLVFNNCEHFANVCTLGRYRSRQVERVLRGQLPLEEDKGMGFLGNIISTIGGWFGGNKSGSRSSSSTTYEPDKVKVAEIESETKIKLATMENERIELMKQARLDILEYETQSNIALGQARAQGLAIMEQTILNMQEKLNEIAEKRLLIIEKGSLQVIKDIENFYNELGVKIKEENDRYNTEKFPNLLSILGRYEEGSPAYKLYFQRIEEDKALQAKYYMQQLDAVQSRQSQIIDGFLASKDKIIEQTGQLTAGMINTIHQQQLALEGSSRTDDATPVALPGSDRLALPQNEQPESYN